MNDADFKSGAERPLRLIAQDHDDLAVVSAMIQDAIAERKEMLFEPSRHTFSLLLRRFRWEDVEAAKRQERAFERVQSVLQFQSVTGVQFAGFDGSDKELVFDLIGVTATENRLTLALAGGGEIAVDVEVVDVLLTDVSRPYIAKSKNTPNHEGLDDVQAG